MGQINRNILLLGSRGMAGHMILKYLRAQGIGVDDIARNNDHSAPAYRMDVTDTSELKRIIEQKRYEVVINCVGVLNHSASEYPDESIFLNSYLPHFLAKQVQAYGGRLIHISTDCVFSGQKGGYTEHDHKDGDSMYALTKSLGEVNSGNHLTIRTSIIGPELKTNGIGLLNWFLHQEGIINGYTRAFWSGVTTLELAKAIVWLLDRPEISGIVHLTNNEKISKYELLELFYRKIGNGKIDGIQPFEGYTTDKSLLNTRKDMQYAVPDYEQMVDELSQWMKSYRELYENNTLSVIS